MERNEKSSAYEMVANMNSIAQLDDTTRLFIGMHQLDALSSRGLRNAIPDSVTERLNGCPATPCNIRIITYLARNEGRTIFQNDIERRCGVTRSTASRVLNLMESKGLVRRTIPTFDARKRQITLTDKSRSIVRDIEQLGEEYFNHLTEGIPQEDLDATMRTVRAIIARAEEEEFGSVSPEDRPFNPIDDGDDGDFSGANDFSGAGALRG